MSAAQQNQDQPNAFDKTEGLVAAILYVPLSTLSAHPGSRIRQLMPSGVKQLMPSMRIGWDAGNSMLYCVEDLAHTKERGLTPLHMSAYRIPEEVPIAARSRHQHPNGSCWGSEGPGPVQVVFHRR